MNFMNYFVKVNFRKFQMQHENLQFEVPSKHESYSLSLYVLKFANAFL